MEEKVSFPLEKNSTLLSRLEPRAESRYLPSMPRQRHHLASVQLVLLLACLLRLLHWLAVRVTPLFSHPVLDSQEYDRWAREIVGGNVWGSETFFQAPLYPYFVGGIYRLFGFSLDAVYLVQIGFAVAGCWALYRAGSRLLDADLGIAAAFLLAVNPVVIFYDVQLLKTSLAVTVTAFLLWALAVAWTGHRAAPWLVVGLLFGVLSLLRENSLLLAPLFLALALWPQESSRPVSRRRSRAGGFTRAAVWSLGLIAVLLPVAWRNFQIGGDFLPTTFQGGVNFYIGNNPEADGTYRPLVAGRQIPFFERTESVRLAQEATGRDLSSAEVSRYWLGRSLAWARSDPGAFLELQWRKLRLYWSFYEWPDAVDFYYTRRLSPALWPPWPEFGALVLLAVVGFGLLWLQPQAQRFVPILLFLLLTMVSTVIFFIFSRYRLTAIPPLILLAAFPVRALILAQRKKWPQEKWLYGALLIISCLVPRGLGYQPRWDMVHYNLGRVAQERGDPETATHHYRETLHHDPESFLACLNLGNFAARAHRLDEARAWYERALALRPDSDDALTNLGGVALQTGDLEAARRYLDTALDLNPRHANALQIRALLALTTGELDAARTYIYRLRAVAPGHPQAEALSHRLERALAEIPVG